jgi:hypothetical protein
MAQSLESSAATIAANGSPSVPASSLGANDNSTSGLDGVLQQMVQKDDASRAELKSKIEPYIKDIESKEPPKPPQLEEIPKSALEQKSPLENFGSAAMWITTLGSLFTKQPLMNSLAAATGVLNAAHANDVENFSRQLDALKIHNDNVEKAANFELETYKAALDKDKDIASVYTSMFKNDTAATMVQAKMADQYYKSLSDQLKLFEANRLDQLVDKKTVSLVDDFTKKSGHPPSEDEMTNIQIEATRQIQQAKKGAAGTTGELSEEDFNKLKDNPEVKGASEAFANGALITQVQPGWGSNNPERLAAIRLAYENHPDLNWADAHLEYMGKTSAERAAATKGTTIELSSNLLNNSLPILKSAFEKVDNSQFTDINSFQNYYKKHTNDPDLTALNEAILNTQSDLALLIRRGGASTVDSQDRADGVINNLMNSKAFDAFEAQVIKESNAAKAAEQKTRQDIVKGTTTAQPSVDTKTSIDTLPAGSVQIGTDRKTGKPVYQTPDGKKFLGGQ